MAKAQELRLAGGSNRVFLLVALLAGLIAAMLVFVAVSNSSDDGKSTIAPGEDTAQVVVATTSISAGTEITADMVKVTRVPESLVLSGSSSDSALLVGQVAAVSVAAGEQVLLDRVGSTVEGEGLGYVLKSGMRAIGLSVEQSSAVGGHLLPGDRVDVIASFEGEDGIVVVVTVLQNIEVLAIAEEALEPISVSAGSADGNEPTRLTSGQIPDDVETQPDASVVTLSVDPQQAQLLVGIQQKAALISLAERAAGDDAPANLNPNSVGSTGPQ